MVRKKILATLGLALAFSFSVAPLAMAATGATAGGSSSENQSCPDPTSLCSPKFTFSANSISPSSYKYDRGSKGNIQMFFEHVSNILLIGIATLAALLITVAGLRMALSAGNTDEASKGKTMLRFNVMALGVALLSYAIVNLITWIISAT